ncbi:DUF5615 family PIN-like protein [Halorhabdus amylolytica]|uniref:DUF5615 family PIN-like protein n=1 Tax=Halorhabdus amylolytica TaxID=2559573 RepID=UPI0010AA56F9|nr:DUF5615 family PIN-like protein [Halorhabdus amylolytica]
MQVRFLLDEDTEASLANKLSASGHDVKRVVSADSLGRGTDDPDVCAFALKTDRTIVTHDDDYLTFDTEKHAGVFFVPNQRLSAHRIYSIIQHALQEFEDESALPAVLYLTEDWL